MSEASLNSINEHVVQLIKMVAENNRFVKGMEERFDSLEPRFDGLEQRFDGLEQRFDGLEKRFDHFEQKFETERELNRLRHEELIKEIRNQHFEIEYIRNQVARHDMEIYKLKQI
jgi:predicted  nucleic acid-binding Zn-ribbon protein